MAPLSRLRAATLLVVAVVVTGVLGYRYLEEYTWFDALYMTAITLSTVGFQEVQPLSQVGRLFTVGLLAAGVGVVFYTIVALAEQVVDLLGHAPPEPGDPARRNRGAAAVTL
jgi:voltage-gated potassium channel